MPESFKARFQNKSNTPSWEERKELQVKEQPPAKNELGW